jgi:hypothetical protein
METFMKQYRVYQTRLVTRTEEYEADGWGHTEEEAIAYACLEDGFSPNGADSFPIDHTIEETWAEEVLV